jgi:AcrR family transcriptional regulator
MPRHADPHERRRQVADALLRVVEAEGLDAASIPRIARELGATTGLVQTYFRSKDELLLFAAEHLGELLRARVAAALMRCADAPLADRLLQAMAVLANADGSEQDGEGRIWLAFLARAVYHPALHDLHVSGAREIRDQCRMAFELAQRQGEIDASLDIDAEAAALAAFADGLAVQRVLEPDVMTKETAIDLLRRYLDRVFTRAGHTPDKPTREAR